MKAKLLQATLAALLGTGLAHNSQAQDQVQNQTSDQSGKTEIIVTAKGQQKLADVLPTSHLLTLDQIEASQAVDLPDLLEKLSGISVTPTGGRGSVTGTFVRGTSIAQNIVLIDGVRVGSATLGQAALNTYPIEAIERVEVVKGPLSGIYGADAVGGVIQVFTKKGGEGLGSARATIGNDGLAEYGLSLHSEGERSSFHISANYEETDGIDHTSIVSGGNNDDDGYEENSYSFSGRLALSENTTAQLSVLYSENDSQFDNTFGADSGFVTETESLSAALNLTSKLSNKLQWVTTLGTNEDQAVTDAFFSDVTTNRDTFGTEFNVQVNQNLLITAGADYYQEDIDTADNFPVTDRDNTGVFALLQANAGKFGIVGSLRHDDNSAYGDTTNGSVAVNFDFTDSMRAVLSYGTAFAAPSFNFLYFPFFGNPDLQPEESKSVELSLLGSKANFDWRVSAYQTDVENLFSFDPFTFLAANIGEAELQGIEFEVATQWAEWNLGARLDLLSAEDTESGVELDDRAETTLRLTAARQFGKLDLAAEFLFEEGRHDNFGTELSSFGLLDLRGSYQINPRISVMASVSNVFDRDYTLNLIGLTERYNTQGRQSKISLRYNF